MAENIPERIATFLKEERILSLATTRNGKPFSCNVFYVFQEEKGYLIFKSEEHTFHIQNALEQPYVSGTIHKSNPSIYGIKGVQFCGIMITVSDEEYIAAEAFYNKQMPFASLKRSPYWVIRLDTVKYIDNKLGIGNKLMWERNKLLV